jgi:hypothetical protein
METKDIREYSASFDRLYQNIICPLFEKIGDERAANTSYKLVDALKSGFAIYSLKFASLFSFRKKTTAENSNLSKIYGINKIPTDNTLRAILDKVSPRKLREGFHDLFKVIEKLGLLKKYRYLDKHLIISVDGVEHFCSKTIHCKHCMERKHRDGSSSFYHSMLSAAIVHPDKKEVFILDNEPILKQDGIKKNDCERNAVHRLFANLRLNYAKEPMIFVFDALYACAPVIKQIQKIKSWGFVINVKAKGNKYLFSQFEELANHDKILWHTCENKAGKHRFSYANKLILNQNNKDIFVNMLAYQWTNLKGETKSFTWITSIELNKSSIYKVMRIGRSRWKIENETFNTLKNQGYNFEHNFGHGNQYLCTVFAFLMFLAFYIDQIQQSSCQKFKKILSELKTRTKFWESIRIVFKIIPCQDMKEIFSNIAQIYQIKLE